MESTDKIVFDLIAKRKRNKKRNIIIIMSCVVAIFIIGIFIPKDENRDSDQSRKAETSKYKSYEIEARLKAEDVAKTHALNPVEAEFSKQKEEIKGDTYYCTGIITSKNDYGVKKEAKYVVKLLHKAGNWEVVSETIFQ